MLYRKSLKPSNCKQNRQIEKKFKP